MPKVYTAGLVDDPEYKALFKNNKFNKILIINTNMIVSYHYYEVNSWMSTSDTMCDHR